MSNTASTTRPRIIRPVAAGLYQTEGKKQYMFRDYGQNCEWPTRINIGRKRACHIFLTDPTVSSLHAFLERRDGPNGHEMWIWNVGDTYFDGHPIREPRVLLVGMTLRLGNVRLITTDDQGRFPIAIYHAQEIYGKALDLHGSQRRAARHIDVSHSTIQRHKRREQDAHEQATKSQHREDKGMEE